MDEAAVRLTGHVVDPDPPAPGREAREDFHYERNGVRALSLFFDPVRDWRRVAARPRRTRADWAEEVKRLLDEDYPEAAKVVPVCDNPNTHAEASLYEASPPEEAGRLRRRLEIVHTPRNGSWLNMAEIELNVLGSGCLDRRIGGAEDLDRELAAWQRSRNEAAGHVEWRSTTSDARVKLRHLYPVQTKNE